VWQALHTELESAGLTIVTVDLDTDIEAARPFHDTANPTHPALVDPALTMVDMFGMTNVPFGLWIDETGTIVRPAEVAFAPRDAARVAAAQAQAAQITGLDPQRQAVITEMLKHAGGDATRYADAVRDWVRTGASSQYVLAADEVIRRSRPRPMAAAAAAAEFELGQHLHRAGHKLDAVPHFQEAHRLDPENWSYPRQAFALVDESMGKPYELDLLLEVGRVGPATFYPELTI
jgi:hypothetical protein